ncbi:MAG: FAD-dependent oxidoreductase [Candidatus Diapherotrites archaeon]|nr:FAD-dependent oxidoreductase [Candidatus Diapherotrites archaeon]
MEEIDLAIIGSGAAGIGAAVYALRRNLKIKVFEKEAVGGQTAKAVFVENYPGFKKITGLELMQKMRDHLQSLGSDVEEGNGVKKIVKSKNGFELDLDEGEKVFAKTVLLATGTENRHLGLKGEEELYGKGVSYCANCDGPFFKGKKVAVVGGGNSGVTNALYLAEMASKVFLFEFMPNLNCDEIYLPMLEKQKIEVMKNTQIAEVLGKYKVSGVKVKARENGKEKKIDVDGVFFYVGLTPQNSLAKQVGAEIDEKGFVKVDENQMSSVNGFFAAGDITGSLAQTIWAAAEGAKAALAIHDFLRIK